MISAELERIIKAKEDIRQSIRNKGVNIGNDVKLDKYNTYINSITTGAEPKLHSLSKTITKNGSYTYTPNTGYDGINNVSINVDVPMPDTSLKILRAEGAFSGNTAVYKIGSVDCTNSADESFANMFKGCRELNQFGEIKKERGSVTSMAGMFEGSGVITTVTINADTSKLTSIASMYRNCEYLFDVNFNNLNTNSLTDMSNFCYGNTYCNSISLNNLNLSNVKNVNGMVAGCTQLQSLSFNGTSFPRIDLRNWGVKDCVNLDVYSLISIGVALPILLSDEVYICEIGSDNLAKLTDEQKLIFTDKGWILM